MLAIAGLAVGCAGKYEYVRPTVLPSEPQNVKVIGRSRDAVLNTSLHLLSERFRSSNNNLDQSSGIINISYNGDPEKYIDCGRITSYVMDVRGERTYDFPASRAKQLYEAMLPSVGLLKIDRKMSLKGRVNLVFEELGPNRTRVTANTCYVIQLNINGRNVTNNTPLTLSDIPAFNPVGSSSYTITFNSGGSSSFPPLSDGGAVECVATGALEQEILSFIR